MSPVGTRYNLSNILSRCSFLIPIPESEMVKTTLFVFCFMSITTVAFPSLYLIELSTRFVRRFLKCNRSQRAIIDSWPFFSWIEQFSGPTRNKAFSITSSATSQRFTLSFPHLMFCCSSAELSSMLSTNISSLRFSCLIISINGDTTLPVFSLFTSESSMASQAKEMVEIGVLNSCVIFEINPAFNSERRFCSIMVLNMNTKAINTRTMTIIDPAIESVISFRIKRPLCGKFICKYSGSLNVLLGNNETLWTESKGREVL